MTYQSPYGDQGPSTIFANVDADGLGAGGFGPAITVSATNVGGFDFIPAQNERSIDAEAGLVWDATGGPFNNRIYLVYTDETVNENNDTEIYVRTSTDDGGTWTAPVRVNDDPLGPIRSHPLTRRFLLDLAKEVVAVGRAHGVALPVDFAEQRIAFADALPAEMTASMHHDLERGNRLELAWLSGGVVDLGQKVGVPTPVNRAVRDILILHADGRRA